LLVVDIHVWDGGGSMHFKSSAYLTPQDAGWLRPQATRPHAHAHDTDTSIVKSHGPNEDTLSS